MKLAIYTLGVIVIYTLIAAASLSLALGLVAPACFALILPCGVHLVRRHRRRRNNNNRSHVA